MELFKVEGWDLGTKKVAYDAGENKKNKKNKNKRKHKNEGESDVSLGTHQRDETNHEPGAEDTRTQKKQVHNLERKKEKKGNKHANKVDKTQTTEIKNTGIVSPLKTDKKVQKPQRKLTALQEKMLAKLSGSRFRWINEQLYTITSQEALELMKKEPQLFDEYHTGFRSQVQSWPENPVDTFVEEIKSRSVKPVNAPGGLPGLVPSKKVVIADMGCGEAMLALKVNEHFEKLNKNRGKKGRVINYAVHSFDLKKVNDRITVADIRNVPLEDNSCSIVIFCLSLMGTNFLDFITEAYRILAPRGELWISEIKSRFTDGKGDEFVNTLKLMGFFHKKTDDSNKMFTRFEFFKPPDDIIEERRAKLERKHKFIETETKREELEEKRAKSAEGTWLLKPCLYKKR